METSSDPHPNRPEPTVSPEDPVAADLFSFIAESPTPFHAAASAMRRLGAAGYTELSEHDDWTDVGGRRMLRRGGALIAWQRPESAAAGTPVRIVGAHTDSPNLRLTPRPDTGRVGYQQVGVEVYGGPLLNSWLDRDLGIAGRLFSNDGSETLVCIDEPLARVTQLAIHLDRDVNDGLKLDRQLHLSPIWGLGAALDGGVVAHVAARAGVDASNVTSFELMFHDVTAPSVIGADRSMYAAPRIDNLTSCHAAVTAMAQLEDDATAVAVLFDHEEVGSSSATGADGAFLAHVLERIELAAGGDRASLLRSVAGSWCLSADGAHAVHPNYLDRHEPEHHVHLNGGPVIKINANVRYATDAGGVAEVRRAATAAGVPLQMYSHRSNLACGSTIGPLTASNLGMSTIDVGAAQLSMHSARELGGVDDPAMMTKLIAAFLADA